MPAADPPVSITRIKVAQAISNTLYFPREYHSYRLKHATVLNRSPTQDENTAPRNLQHSESTEHP